MTTVRIPEDWNPQGLLPPNDAVDPTSAERSPYTVSLTDLVLHFGTTKERHQLLAEKTSLERMLAGLPESSVIDRMSLEARKAEVEKALAAASAPAREHVRARLTFRGKPIIGSHGMFAEFGAKATSKRKQWRIRQKTMTENNQKQLGKTLWNIADDFISAQTKKIELLKQHKKGLTQGLFPAVEI
jgi:hypothetical protein